MKANFGDDQLIQKVDYVPFKESMQFFSERFLFVYREYVTVHFKEYYETFPEYFPFMKPIEWKVVFNNSSIDNYLYISTSDTFSTFSNQFSTLGESRAFYQMPKFTQKEKIAEILSVSEAPKEFFQVKYGFPAQAIIADKDHVTKDPSDMPKIGEIMGREFAELHGEKARAEKYELFNLFGLDELIQKIDSPSFEYELGESIKAYRSGLYLAAAATAGIALENILRVLIIKYFDKKRLPDKTYIDRSVRVLEEKKILPGRLRADILKSVGVRNANAHTNEDPVRKDTVDALYRIIYDVGILV